MSSGLSKALSYEPPPIHPETYRIFEELKEAQKGSYLTREKLKDIAKRRGLEFRDLHAIASFYPHFYLDCRPRVTVGICDDLSCHLRGAPILKRELEEKFYGKIKKEDLDDFKKEQLNICNVSCLGRCDQAPAFVISDSSKDTYFDSRPLEGNGPIEEQAVTQIQRVLDGAGPLVNSEFVLPANPPVQLRIDPYSGQRPYSALRDYVRSGHWKHLLTQIDCANLRGMGGAGYPTFKKWKHVHDQSPEEFPQKFIVCNADESEPGTIKDRYILTYLPHLVIEGLILGGLCTGAKRGYIYIRHEYQEQEDILRDELQRCFRDELVGKSILGSGLSFDIEIFASPGGYICGEETALLEAIEGKRAEPRNRPPLLVDKGLWQNPTIVNNVETLVAAAAIAAKGPQWFFEFNKRGGVKWIDHTDNDKEKLAGGPKFFGISGDVERPGVYEAPLGTTYRELIYEYAKGGLRGCELIAFAPSGPSSGFLPTTDECLDMPAYWDTVAKKGSIFGSCAIVVIGKGRCMLEMALNAVRFYRNESCGKCVPCRLGSQKMLQIIERWLQGDCGKHDRKMVDELDYVLRKTSICALGQAVPAPVQSAIKYFPEELIEHLENHISAEACSRRRTS